MYLSRNSWNGKIDDHGAHEACFKSKIEYSRQTIKVCNSYRMNSTTTLVNLIGFLIHCASVIPGLCETRLSLHHYRTDRWTHLGSFNCSYDSTLMLLYITGPGNFQHQVQSIFFANNCFEFFQVYQMVSFMEKRHRGLTTNQEAQVGLSPLGIKESVQKYFNVPEYHEPRHRYRRQQLL